MRSSRPSITKPRKERVRADLAPLLLLPLLLHLLLLLLPPPLLLPVQKFRLPGKSWDPIIRVSSIVMQITITNRRQGRSPGRYRGKRISVGSLSLFLSVLVPLVSRARPNLLLPGTPVPRGPRSRSRKQEKGAGRGSFEYVQAGPEARAPPRASSQRSDNKNSGNELPSLFLSLSFSFVLPPARFLQSPALWLCFKNIVTWKRDGERERDCALALRF